MWIVDARQQVLADSAEALKPPSGAGQANLPIRQPLVDRLPEGMGSADLDQTLFSPGQVYRHAGWVLLSAVRIGSPWLYVQAVPEAMLRIQVLPTLLPNALLGLALLALFVTAQWLVSRRFVQPALAVLNYLRQRSLDADQPAPNLGPRWQVWTDAVTKVFSAQHELRQRERRSEIFKSAIVDNAVTAIVTTDNEGHIVEFNPTAERLFGRHRDGVMGRVLGEVLLPERRRAAHRAEMARMRHGERIAGLGRPTEMLGLRADGLEFPFEMLVVEIDIDDQVFFTGFMTDLTERRTAALQIERQRDALRQSEKLNAMGSLLAGVAHELNNPLAIVMGRASLLQEKTEGTPLADDAQRIREAAERCGRIVRSYLNMARQKPADHAPVQLNDIVQAAAEMLGYTLRSHGIELNLDLAEELPEVMADGDQIGQVVLNLMVNAQQALTAAEPPRRITLQTGVEARRENREPRVWLRVQDNGPGIAIALRDRVFEPFFTTKGEGIGTGLGLSVSRAMVREHGGDLCIESSDPGARFRLGLPIAGGANADKPSPRLDAPQDAPQARVLVVDDEAEITDLIRAMLESAGYEVATAESGALALGLLDVARFDAIISDLRMPDMDGAELWRQVAARSAGLAQRMLFATGDALSADARQMLAKTGCRSLEKPFSKVILLATLRDVLQSSVEQQT